MKQIVTLFFSLFLIQSITSCGTDERDFNEGNNSQESSVIEEQPYATIQNSDGTFYTLHAERVCFRDANYKIIAEHEYSNPEDISINMGYGDIATLRFAPYKFYTSDLNLIILFNISNLTLNEEPIDATQYAYVFTRDLSSLTQKEFAHGLTFFQPDNEIDVLTATGQFYTYTPEVELLKYFPRQEAVSNFFVDRRFSFALGKINGLYYIMSEIIPNTYPEPDAGILCCNDGAFVPIRLVREDDLIHRFFPDETQNPPRPEGTTFSFSDGNFNVNFNFTKYNGEKTTITYIYSPEGKQISPIPDPETFYIAKNGFSNIGASTDEAIENNDFILYYPNGAAISVSAWHEFNGTIEPIEYEVNSSNPNVMCVSEISINTYELIPLQSSGEVDLIFTSPICGEIERWHFTIVDRNSQSR